MQGEKNSRQENKGINVEKNIIGLKKLKLKIIKWEKQTEEERKINKIK